MSFNVRTASIFHFWRYEQIQEETAFTDKADMHLWMGVVLADTNIMFFK